MKDKSTVGGSKSLDEVLQRKSGIKCNHTWIESENFQLTGENAAPMKNSIKISRRSKEENLPRSKPVKGGGDTGGDKQDLEMPEVNKSDTEEVGSLVQDTDEQDLQSNTVSGTDEFTQEMSGSLLSKRLRMYKCERCSSQFMGLAMLRQHCKDVHGDQKYYKCHVCGKLFSHPSSRNIHLRLHSGEKPYKCTTCGKQFRVSSHLKDHVRVHTGERPYICDICHKGFKQSSDLKKHRRTHTLDKPYKCPICPSAFTRSHHCRGHINSVHKFFKCVACSALFTSEEAFERHKELHPTVFSDDRRSRLSDDVVTPRNSMPSEMLSSSSSDSIQVDAETRENNLKWDVANQLLELHKISQHTTSRKNSNNSGSETESVDDVSSAVKQTSAITQAVPEQPLVSPTVVPHLTYQGASVSNNNSSSPSQKEPMGVSPPQAISLGNGLQEEKRMQGNTIMYPPMPLSIPQGMEYLMLPFQNMNYKKEEKCVSSQEGMGHSVVLPVALSPSPSKNISACTSEKQKWSREDQPCSVTTTASSVYSMVNNARLYDSGFATRSGSANQRNFMELSLGGENSQQEKALTEETVEGNNSVACHRVSVIQFHSSSQLTPHNTKNPEDLIKEEEKTQEAHFKSDISPLCDSTLAKLDKKPVVIQQQHQDLQPKNGMINIDYLPGISQGHVPYVPLNAESSISLQSWKREFGGPFGKYSWALKEAKKTFELLKMREQALQLTSSQSLESKQFTIFPQANARQSKSSFDRSQVTSVDMLKFLAREQIKQNDTEGDLKSPVSAEEDSESSEAVESGHTSNNEQPTSDGGQQPLPADSPEQKGSPENTIHHCQVCKKTFSRSSLLKQHSVIHMGNKRFKFRCEVCGKMFRTRSHLRDHTRIHTGERPFKCHICQKAFKQSSDLKKHINLHTGTNQFKCEECNMEFRRADALRKHKLGHRTGNMPCGHCGKNFLHISALRQHRAMHNVQPVKTNRAFHRCNFCFKTFTKAESFKVHLEEHTQEQSSAAIMPFDCKICSMKFFVQEEFTDHMNIHNGKRPYKCFVCEKEFCIAEHLQDHVRLHAEASSRLRREEGNDQYQRQAELTSHSAIHA